MTTTSSSRGCTTRWPGRLWLSGDATDDAVKIVTPQSIPSSVLPSMVASMIPGDPATERVEDWHADGDGYSAQFSVVLL